MTDRQSLRDPLAALVAVYNEEAQVTDGESCALPICVVKGLCPDSAQAIQDELQGELSGRVHSSVLISQGVQLKVFFNAWRDPNLVKDIESLAKSCAEGVELLHS
jgi:hypothetical protein